MSESTKASLPDLKKALVRPSKKSDRPRSNADSNATQKRLAGSRWNLAGASGLNCVSRVSKGRRVLYPALNNRTWSHERTKNTLECASDLSVFVRVGQGRRLAASTMPEFLSWLSTRSLTKRCGSCWWLGLTQRTKCECEARSVRIRSSSCLAYFSATYPARLPPPRAPPVMALMVPTEKSLERIGEVDEDIHTCRSSCKVSVFFFSQPSVRYTTSPAKCVTTKASLCVNRCPLPPAWYPDVSFGGKMHLLLRLSARSFSVMPSSFDFGNRECSASALKIELGDLPEIISRHSELSSHSITGQTMPSRA